MVISQKREVPKVTDNRADLLYFNCFDSQSIVTKSCFKHTGLNHTTCIYSYGVGLPGDRPRWKPILDVLWVSGDAAPADLQH
jgi:hypothetical protein